MLNIRWSFCKKITFNTNFRKIFKFYVIYTTILGNLFAKCDRGVKHIVDTVVISEVGNPYTLNPDFLKDLMYDNKSDDYNGRLDQYETQVKLKVGIPVDIDF